MSDSVKKWYEMQEEKKFNFDQEKIDCSIKVAKD